MEFTTIIVPKTRDITHHNANLYLVDLNIATSSSKITVENPFFATV